MIYGLYLSASGVLSNSYRQDVIANNLANSQTVGFKRSLAMMQARRAEAGEQGQPQLTDPTLENMGGGLLQLPSFVDQTAGPIEPTGNNLDVAINGKGYFVVQAGDQTKLTRNGQFMVDRAGYLILADGTGNRVLDKQLKPIQLGNVPQSLLSVKIDGTITSSGEPLAQLGFFDVPTPAALRQNGGTLLTYPDMKKLKPASGTLQSGFTESSNVDPTTELTQLIDAERQLEANANMIRIQDQTLSRAVNDVGKIS
ncbi:MAG TPA: flagellar hook basal-body protein [Tepidisphaeraceae bacterium]|nr:flagellar hook basal-body protein [Tepidisphaeraceae bacterium]